MSMPSWQAKFSNWFKNHTFTAGGRIGHKIADWLTSSGDASGLSQAELEANAFNARQAEIERNWNADEAQKARDENRYLSNTAIQRGVADARAAGLNPYFALNSGATVTASPVASAPSARSITPGYEKTELSSGLALAGTAIMAMARFLA